MLGPLAASADGHLVPLAGAGRLVLAVLLTAPGRMVGMDEIVSGLWGEKAPAGARKAVQSYVSRLRHVLATGGSPAVVVTRAPGYLLDVAPDAVDAVRFERLVGEARRFARIEAWPLAREKLAAALSLWGGEPFEEFAGQPFAELAQNRLTQLRLQALELRIDADLALGAGSELVLELETLLARHPHHERLWAQLVLALYRAGRQSDALGAYRRARDVLIEQVGVEPGVELRRLEQAVLAQDPALEQPARSAAEPAAAVPRQLPSRPAHFVGRDDELKQLGDLPDGPGQTIITIDGTAGVGKTALAVHWAHEIADHFPDGQLYVNLRGFDPGGTPMRPAEAVRGFLDAFAIPPDRIPASLDAQAALYRGVLADRKVLVLLDNARDVAQVRPLLPAGSGCLVMITCRNSLTSLLANEGTRLVTLQPLTETDSTALLARRLGVWRIAKEPGAVAELIDHCARLPLALAIVATRAAINPQFQLAQLAGELRDERTRLDALDAADPDTGIRSVFSWSYQSLTPAAARVFRLLTMHPGPAIGLPACASLTGLEPAPARAAMAELTRAHLIEEPVPGRFTFHDLLHAYANDQLHRQDAPHDRQTALNRLLDHYLHTSLAADRLLNPIRDPIAIPAPNPGTAPETFTDYRRALGWFDREHPALLALVALAAGHGFDRHAWQIPWTIVTFLDRRSHWSGLAAAADIALSAARRIGDRQGQARAHGMLGRSHAWLGAASTAHDHLRAALHLFSELGDLANQALTHRAIAWIRERENHPEQAMDHAQQALTLYRRIGRRDGEARALNSVGWYHALLGEADQALILCQQALELHQENHNPDGAAHTWDSLGYAHHSLGRHDEAEHCYRQSIQLFHRLGDAYYEAAVLVRLGDTLHAADAPTQATTAWDQALAILDVLRHPDADHVRAKITEAARP